MTDSVYKIIEITGTSNESIEKAIESGIGRAGSSLDLLRWFQIVEIRGSINKTKVDHYQVTLKIGFALKDEI